VDALEATGKHGWMYVHFITCSFSKINSGFDSGNHQLVEPCPGNFSRFVVSFFEVISSVLHRIFLYLCNSPYLPKHRLCREPIRTICPSLGEVVPGLPKSWIQLLTITTHGRCLRRGHNGPPVDRFIAKSAQGWHGYKVLDASNPPSDLNTF